MSARCSPTTCTGRSSSAPVRYALTGERSAAFPHGPAAARPSPTSTSMARATRATRRCARRSRERYGVAVEQVVAADGTSMANFLAMAALIAPGDEVLIEHPTYEPMLGAASFLGADDQAVRAQAGGRIPARSGGSRAGHDRPNAPDRHHQPPQSRAARSPTRTSCARSASSPRSVGARVLVDEVYLDAAVPPRRSAVHLGARVRHHQQPDQGLRPERPALRLDPRRARARRADVAAERPVRRQPGASRPSGSPASPSTISTRSLGDTPALLDRNRALVQRLRRRRATTSSARPPSTASPPSRAGPAATPQRLDDLLRERYDTVGRPRPLVRDARPFPRSASACRQTISRKA